MSENTKIDIFEVTNCIRKRLATLRNSGGIKIALEEPDVLRRYSSVTVRLETATILAQATFWDIGTGDIGAYDTKKKELLLDYQCEIDHPEEAIVHVEKLISLF